MTIDAIRYYMELGLIIPGRHGSLYDFADDSVEDLQLIQKLKDMAFSLKEIHDVLSLRRTSNWVEPQEIAEYIFLLEEKKKSLVLQAEEIQLKIGRIELEQDSLSRMNAGDRVLIGVPLRSLEYLSCPACGKSFSVENVQMNSRYIYNGHLYCSCGYELQIEEGIILTPSAKKTGDDGIASAGADLTREKYKNLPSSVITTMQRTYNFILHRVNALPLKDKVILETDINEFFYLYTHFRKIENQALFIVTDQHADVLHMYKERIEYMKLDLDIVYLSDSSGAYPLKKECVDLRLDYFSANAQFYKNKQFFDLSADKWMKSDGRVIGCCFSGIYGACHFSHEAFHDSMKLNQYQLLKERLIPCPPEIGENNSLFLYEYVNIKKPAHLTV